MSIRSFLKGLAISATAAAAIFTAAPSIAAQPTELNASIAQAQENLLRTRPGAARLFDRAAGVLIIPEVTKVSLVVGGAGGEGGLIENGRVTSYWTYGAASLGYQLGAQTTSQALFFMTPEALAKFKAGDGFEIGADAEVTVLDKGAEVNVDTTEASLPIIAIVYNREGLLAGASLQGGKYTRVEK